MMNKLFFLVYICIGVVTLFQASKLIGTIFEKSVFNYRPDSKIKSVEIKEHSPIIGYGYDPTMLVSPLFSLPQTASLEGEINEENAIPQSPFLKRYVLNGVILLGGSKSIALIRKAGERTSQIYHVGDRLDNAEIVKMERDRVILKDGLNTIILPMYYRYMEKTASRTQVPEEASQASDKYSGAKQVKKILSRSDVENKVFKRVNELLTQIAISPYMKDGKMEGLRLVRIPKDNIVYELGGRSGDVVRRVNGHEVNQIDQMYKLWENIKDDSYINVDLERNNQIFTYSFEIRE
jgi:type II secretion system protein C